MQRFSVFLPLIRSFFSYSKNITLFFSGMAVCIMACTKKNSIELPQLDVVHVTASKVNTAVVANRLISDGGSALIAVGTCWSTTNPHPSLDSSNGHTTNKAGADGHFTDSLRGLTYNTKYYLRAYAINSMGTAYSATDSFYTLQTPFPPGSNGMGGTILMVDSTGMHGLVVAAPQRVVYFRWANEYIFLGGTSTSFGSGSANTDAIVNAGNSDTATAAAYCKNLIIGGYDDWFLPSYEELQYFRNYMTFVQWLNYPQDMYWSSSEANSSQAYFVVIGGIADFHTYDKEIGKAVLPMRRF